MLKNRKQNIHLKQTNKTLTIHFLARRAVDTRMQNHTTTNQQMEKHTRNERKRLINRWSTFDPSDSKLRSSNSHFQREWRKNRFHLLWLRFTVWYRADAIFKAFVNSAKISMILNNHSNTNLHFLICLPFGKAITICEHIHFAKTKKLSLQYTRRSSISRIPPSWRSSFSCSIIRDLICSRC